MKNEMMQKAKENVRLAMGVAAIGAMLWAGGQTCRAQNPPPPLPPGVQDVVKLSKAGMSDDVIMAQIKNNGASYNLTADQILYLNSQGISQPVIKALIQPGAAPAAPAPAPPTPAAPPSAPAYAPTPTAPTYVPAPEPSASATVNYDYFHGQLAPYGTWADVPGYGWCWRPTVAMTDPVWRPYGNAGHWVYTDQGWFWQSDYPWGDIAFHYGRWYRDTVGWIWVPGYDWAPAWVCWRHSDGYCGWAPLPPAAVFRVGVGLEFNGRVGVNVGFGLGWDAFTFVAYDHFWDRDLHAWWVPHDRVEVIFHRSVVMNGYRMDHGRFVMEGLGRDHIASYTHHDVRVEAPIFHDARIERHAQYDRNADHRVVHEGGPHDDHGGRDDHGDHREWH